MTTTAESRTPRVSAFRWAGPAVSVLLVAAVAAQEGGGLDAAVGQAVSVLAILAGAVWALRGPHKLRRLGELYLWLAFILAMYHLHALAQGIAGWTQLETLDVFRAIAVLHVAVVTAALWGLGAWSKQGDPGSYLARLAVGVLIVGAVVFWVGARTFPGMALEEVRVHLAGHLWTSVNFLLASLLTLAGFALFTVALRDAGERVFSILGLVAFAVGTVFWVLHLTFRMTVLVEAAEAWSRSSVTPPWFEPWREWAALLFGLYTALAYLGLAAYGGALLRTGWTVRWVGWLCVVAGLPAAALGGLPLLIHVVPWLFGILLLRQERPWRGTRIGGSTYLGEPFPSSPPPARRCRGAR